MDKIKVVLLDDEEHSVETLAWKLERFYPEIQILEKFTDAPEALEYLQKHPLDLLFLDIEMPRLNGFEVLEELSYPLPFEVIFITAYDDFGIRAVKADALDYLLKPVQNKELKAAIEKYKIKHQQQTPLEPPSTTNAKTAPTKIALSTNESIEFVFPEEIICCSSESNYTRIFLINGRKKLISKTLKEVESWLSPFAFYRAHNSHLVNLHHIKEYLRADGGSLLLTDGNTLPVARNRKEELLKLIG